MKRHLMLPWYVIDTLVQMCNSHREKDAKKFLSTLGFYYLTEIAALLVVGKGDCNAEDYEQTYQALVTSGSKCGSIPILIQYVLDDPQFCTYLLTGYTAVMAYENCPAQPD